MRSLVELHGGRVDAQSDGPDGGSEFIVRLPLGRRGRLGRRRAAGRRPAAPATRDGLHVLIVEDNPDGRESLRDLLEIWGHQVEVAASGPRASSRPSPTRPDVALVDIGLPGLDGNEVARRIRAVLRPRSACT